MEQVLKEVDDLPHNQLVTPYMHPVRVLASPSPPRGYLAYLLSQTSTDWELLALRPSNEEQYMCKETRHGV